MKIKALMKIKQKKAKNKKTSGIGFANTCIDILRFKFCSPSVANFHFSLLF